MFFTVNQKSSELNLPWFRKKHTESKLKVPISNNWVYNRETVEESLFRQESIKSFSFIV